MKDKEHTQALLEQPDVVFPVCIALARKRVHYPFALVRQEVRSKVGLCGSSDLESNADRSMIGDFSQQVSAIQERRADAAVPYSIPRTEALPRWTQDVEPLLFGPMPERCPTPHHF